MKVRNNLIPTRRMKKVFKVWWEDLSVEEQERVRGCVYAAYAEDRGIKVEDIKQHVEDIKKEHREATARARA